MRRLIIAHGLYIDALPTGEYACLRPDGENGANPPKGLPRTLPDVLTHAGPVACPQHPGGKILKPLFVRVTNVNGFRFAGQSSDSPETLQYAPFGAPAGWQFLPKVACGTSPVIYDLAGLLHISDCSIGTQGWRYVDLTTGALVTGDATYGPWNGLNEWSALGEDLYVGQGNKHGGTLVWDDRAKVMHVLDPGPNRFIRAQVAGDLVSIAWWVEGINTSTGVVVWATLLELRALPVLEAPAPPVPVPIPPVPVPVPPPPVPPLPPHPSPGPVPPRPHPPEPLIMPKTLIFSSMNANASFPVTQGPHQDGRADGPFPGCISLARADGSVATCPGGVLSFKKTTPGADERFYDAGNLYVGIPSDGSQPFAFPKSGEYGK